MSAQINETEKEKLTPDQKELLERQVAPEDVPEPETAEQADQRRLDELGKAIPQYETSSQRTDQELGQAIDKLNEEPPAVEISTGTKTKEDLEIMQTEQTEIQARTGEAKRIDPETGTDQAGPEDAPVDVEASHEQMKVHVEEQVKGGLAELAAEVKVARVAAPDLKANQIRELPAMAKIKESFAGSAEVSGEEVDKDLEDLANRIAESLKDNPPEENIETNKIESMGLETLDEKIKAAAKENPQKKKQSTHAKTQEEKKVKKKNIDEGELTGRQTQDTEEEGLRPSA
ncbi:hypothetical protein ACFL0Z_00930 [Patescibacteria group bacterium]